MQAVPASAEAADEVAGVPSLTTPGPSAPARGDQEHPMAK